MKVFFPFIVILNGLIGYTFALWALCKKPHQEALKETGIRIVSLANEAAENRAKTEIAKALNLLERNEIQTFEELKMQVKTIFLFPFGLDGAYFLSGRICILNLNESIPLFDRPDPIELAGLLVFFTNLGKYGGRPTSVFGKWNDDLVIRCRQEQRRVVKALTDIVHGGHYA